MENNFPIDLDEIYGDIQQRDETEENLNHLQALLDKYPELINRKHSIHKIPLINWVAQVGKTKFVEKLSQNNAELVYEKIVETSYHSSLGYAVISENSSTIKYIFDKLKLLLADSSISEESKYYLKIILKLTKILYIEKNTPKHVEAKLEELMRSTLDAHKELLISGIIDIVSKQNENFIAIWKKTIRYYSDSDPGALCLLHNNFAQSLFQLNQLATAEEYLNEAVLQLEFITDEIRKDKCRKSLKQTFNQLGAEYFNQQAYKKSISCYQMALKCCLISDIESLYLLYVNYTRPLIQLTLLIEAETQLNNAASLLEDIKPDDRRNKFCQFISQLYYELATQYFIEKKYDEAIRCFKKALVYCLSSSTDYLHYIHISIAEAYLQLKQPTESESYLNMAISQLNTFTDEDKKDEYKQSLKNLFNAVGIVYFEQQAYAQAILCYKNAIIYCQATDTDSLCPVYINNAQASLRLGKLIQTKKYSEMAASLLDGIIHNDKTIKFQQNLKEIFCELADEHFGQQSYEQAFDNYKKALSYCSPSDANSLCIIHTKCGKSLIQLNQLIEAENYLSNAESALKIIFKESKKNTNSDALVQAFNDMGLLYYSQQKYEQAIKCYKNALLYCLPFNTDWRYCLHINYAQALVHLNQLAETETQLDKAISQLKAVSHQFKKDKRHKENLFQLLFALHNKYLENKKYEKALSYFDQTITYSSSANKKKLLPARASLLQALGQTLANKQKTHSYHSSSSESSSSTQFFVSSTRNKNFVTQTKDKKLTNTVSYILRQRTELILKILSKDKNDTTEELYKDYLTLISCDEKSATLDIALKTANLTLERFFKSTLDLSAVVNKIKEFLQHKKAGFNEQALAYYQEKNYSTALLYWQITEKYFNDTINTSLKLATLYSNMASCYRELHQYNEAIDYCQKALGIRKHHTTDKDLIKKSQTKLEQIIQLKKQHLNLVKKNSSSIVFTK